MTNRNSLAKLAALLVATSMLVGALAYVPYARAADTPNEWFEEMALPIGPSDADFYDVEWTPDGDWALWVGSNYMTGYACAWWYELATDAWLEAVCIDEAPGIYPIGVESYEFHTVCYMPSHPSFNECYLVMGDDSDGFGACYFIDVALKGQLIEQHMGAVEDFNAYGSVYDSSTNSVIVVGGDYYGAHAFRYFVGSEDFGPGPLCSDTSDTANVWFDVALDDSQSPADYYFVGKHDHQPTRGGGGAGIYTPTPDYQMWDSSAGTLIAIGLPMGFDFLTCIEWESMGEYMVMAGSSSSGAAILYRLVKSGTTRYDAFYEIQDTLDETSMIWDLNFDDDGKGVAVGDWTDESYIGYALIADIWFDGIDYTVVQRSDASAMFMGDSLNGVDIVPSGNPVALLAGSAYKYHYTAASSNIQIDTLFPHIDYIDLYDAGTTTSRLNGQVDVDPGDDSTMYDLTVRAWHNSGKENLISADVYMWYDWGGEGFPAAPFDSMGTENSRIHLRWTRGMSDTFQRIINYGGSNEAALDVANSVRVDDPGSDNITLTFRFVPHQQIRSASGQGGLAFPFFEPPGDMYGTGASEQQSNPAALNAINSWNIRVDVVDTGSAVASAYDEFGVYKYTYLGTSGLPGGGNVIGSGPPNTVATLSPTADVTYSANCPYQLTVSGTDLTGQLYGGTITADLLGVTGGQIGGTQYFTGVGAPIYLWGDDAPMTYQQPLDMYTTTTTSSPGGWQVTFYCDIPGVAEDYYRGTLTYSLLHGP